MKKYTGKSKTKPPKLIHPSKDAMKLAEDFHAPPKPEPLADTDKLE